MAATSPRATGALAASEPASEAPPALSVVVAASLPPLKHAEATKPAVTRKQQRALDLKTLHAANWAAPGVPQSHLTIGTLRTSTKTELTIAYTAGDKHGELLALLRGNMAALYAQSSWGWSDKKKLKELKHPLARFLVIRDGSGTLCGFVHYRFELEEGGEDDGELDRRVLYVYEIQIAPSFTRQGIGKRAMTLCEMIARCAQMSHVMLTVFDANKVAGEFYGTIGYALDTSSPQNYGEKVDYRILSKRL